ncbi:MAG: hypothetical protein ACR2PZ_06095 [Pseudomonadales bacterium]
MYASQLLAKTGRHPGSTAVITELFGYAPIKSLTLAIQLAIKSMAPSVQAPVDTIASTVQPMVDVVASTIQTMGETIFAMSFGACRCFVETAIDTVALPV